MSAPPTGQPVDVGQAISIAQQQSAKFWELRAATSLGRLWSEQGKLDAARNLLGPIHGWFTEGFDTSVLMEAKAVLTVLEEGHSNVVGRPEGGAGSGRTSRGACLKLKTLQCPGRSKEDDRPLQRLCQEIAQRGRRTWRRCRPPDI